MTLTLEEAPANSVPAAAVIRRVQALIGITGRKARSNTNTTKYLYKKNNDLLNTTQKTLDQATLTPESTNIRQTMIYKTLHRKD